MRVFHGCAESVTDEGATGALRRLGEALQALSQRALAAEDFERFERAVHALFVAAEREVLCGELARLDVDLPSVSIGGVRDRRVLRSPEPYLSAVGPLTVERTLYRAGREPAVVPLERRAGSVEGHWTALAARQAAYLVAHLPPQEAEGVCAALGNMTPSKRSLDRLPKHLSVHWAARREAFEASLRAELGVPEGTVTLAASLDGVRVPMQDGERQAKRAQARAGAKETRGPAGYQEVGCATLSFYDADGERLSTVRFARLPEAKKATLKSTLSAAVQAVLAQLDFPRHPRARGSRGGGLLPCGRAVAKGLRLRLRGASPGRAGPGAEVASSPARRRGRGREGHPRTRLSPAQAPPDASPSHRCSGISVATADAWPTPSSAPAPCPSGRVWWKRPARRSRASA